MKINRCFLTLIHVSRVMKPDFCINPPAPGNRDTPDHAHHCLPCDTFLRNSVMCFCFSHISRLKDFLRHSCLPRCYERYRSPGVFGVVTVVYASVYDAQHFSELIKKIKIYIMAWKIRWKLFFLYFAFHFPSVINFTVNLTAHRLKW